MQYFEHVACPADVLISTEDADSWVWYPRWRWIYDKVAVALSQGLEAAPHGVEPKGFPVFSKPITNLKGMGVGSRVLRSAADYVTHYAPGHMWMTLLDRPARLVRCGCARRAAGVVAPHDRRAGRRGHVRLLDRSCRARRRDRAALRRLDREAFRRLHRHAQSRDHRRAHHRGASALRRPVAGPLWQGLGRGAGAALRAPALGLSGQRPARRLQRRAVLPTRPTLSPSAASAGRRGAWDARRSPACRSRSTRTSRPTSTPCRRAAFGLPL